MLTGPLDEALARYDAERKKEGYHVAYRHWLKYEDLRPGRHIETMYLSSDPDKPGLLVKTWPDGQVAAFTVTA